MTNPEVRREPTPAGGDYSEFYLLDKDYKVLIKNEGSLNKVEAMLKQLTAN